MAVIERRIETAPVLHHMHITPAEWRWVIAASCSLVALAFVPLMLLALVGAPGWQFMGVLHNDLDGATYLSKMQLGAEGNWLVYFQHTPDVHDGAFIQVLYLVMGHVARITDISPIVLFHGARAIAGVAMFSAIYQLGTTIWERISSRRLFFAIASFGAGFGWLLAPLTGDVRYPDVVGLPEAFPFFSALVNVHFPLTIALLAVLASMFIVVFRPGSEHDESVRKGWPAAGLVSITIGFLYPQALVPFAAAVVAVGLSLWRGRRLRADALRWIAALILPVIPLAVYYALSVQLNPALAEWSRQNVTLAPELPVFLLGFGLPLLIGLPAWVRGFRRFERDGDRLMLLWGLAIVVIVFLPTSIQRRFAVGLMLPIAYFAVRALEAVWLPRIRRRRVRGLIVFALLALMSVSSFVVAFLPALPALAGNPGASVRLFLPEYYRPAFTFLADGLADRAQNTVVLAAPAPSAWLPAWAGTRVVYGHPFETLRAEARLAAVEAWYALDGSDPAACSVLLDSLNIRYVLVGPLERALGPAGCVNALTFAAQFGPVGGSSNGNTVVVYVR
jgi:hypothetical protein